MKTMEELREKMDQAGLSDCVEALTPMVKNAVRITLEVCPDDDLPLGTSKFGGQPDLPRGVEWFRTEKTDIPMSFVAQVNFAQVSPFDLDHKLPQQGMLYFFYDCSPDGMPWGFNPEDSDGWAVFFYDGDLANLTRVDAPEDLTEEDNGMAFGSARMCFASAVELPSSESDLYLDLENTPDIDALEEFWEQLEEEEEEEEAYEEMSNKLLGHAEPIQSAMERECEYVTNNINCGSPDGYRIAKSRGLDKNASRWNLLMQVDSNEEIGMMWGDLGRLYLWITNEDLAARKFENSWLILQCY